MSDTGPALSRVMELWLARWHRPPLYQRMDQIDAMLRPIGRDGMAGGQRIYKPTRGPIYAAGAAGRERILAPPVCAGDD